MITADKILLFGGTGSLSQEYVKQYPDDSRANLIVFSRDEYKQYKMQEKYPDIKYILGDIRDYEAVFDAVKQAEIVINFAALKQIDTLERNTLEAVSTNVYGSKNISRACKDFGMWKVINISTDKAVNPSSTYGYTKAISEKIFLDNGFTVARLGNVIPSRGCFVWKLNRWWNEGIAKPEITAKGMTRFWMKKKEVPDFLNKVIEAYIPNRIYIPKLPAFMLSDLVKAYGFEDMQEVGMREGEKQYEILFDGPAWKKKGYWIIGDEFNDVCMQYSSKNCEDLLEVNEIEKRLKEIFEEEETEG